MQCVVKKMYEASASTVLLEEEKSAMFNVELGVHGVVAYPQYYSPYS